MKKVKEFLHKFGLTDVETEIYLALLQTGPSSVLDIAKKTKIKRSTVHINVETLIEKGLTSQTKEGARRKIIAEPPEHLSVLLERRKVFVEELDYELDDFVGFLRRSMDLDKSSEKVDVRYYTGKETISRIYDEVLKSEEIRAYVDNEDIAVSFPENFEKFMTAAGSGKTEIWDIQRMSPQGRSFKKTVSERHLKKYHVKYFPIDMQVQQMDYLIYSNKIAILHGGRTSSAIVINNELIYRNAKIIFDVLWSLLPELY